jgi:NADH dehydrogenase
MRGDLIVVFGGSGFIGRQVVRALAKRGKRVRVPMRRPHLGLDLRIMGDVGQIQLVQANVRNEASIKRALEGASGVVNLVGILAENGRQTFTDVQAEGAARIARTAASLGIERMVQLSAIGADPYSKSRYGRSKGLAEKSVCETLPQAVILRPSIVFGADDSFFNRFADMARLASMAPLIGALPLIGGGRTRFQPVFVGDVAEAVCAALDRSDARGRIFELGGPRIYTFKELLQYILRETARSCTLVPLPFFLAEPLGALIAAAFRLVPFAEPPLTGDQVRMLRRDNVVAADGSIGTFADLGVTELETVEAIAPTYLWRFRPHGQFETRAA